jgi:hypothetical protein
VLQTVWRTRLTTAALVLTASLAFIGVAALMPPTASGSQAAPADVRQGGASVAETPGRAVPTVVVTGDEIGAYKEAIRRTVAAAGAAAVKLGYDMPPTITVRVYINARERPRLFNDGAADFSLTLRSEADLRKPASTGIFHIYGLCHEVAHLAMYRPITDREWMTNAAAEGWAHYLGSRLVDEVFAREGMDLWPDRYAYAEDGLARLTRQLTGAEPSPTVRGAGLWRDLVALVGDKGMVALFAAWGRVRVDPADPGAVLATAIPDGKPWAWWAGAKDVLVLNRPSSTFTARTAAAHELAGEARELSHDDGTMAGKKSMAGTGHAVRFASPGAGHHLTAVKLHGSRYGTPQAPDEKFTVTLCDEKFQKIAEFKFPYATFERGEPKWVTLDVKPTAVPATFYVCVAFNPTARKGVYVSHDAGVSGTSYTGLPGGRASAFGSGDWMIRVTVDQRRGGDGLRPAE